MTREKGRGVCVYLHVHMCVMCVHGGGGTGGRVPAERAHVHNFHREKNGVTGGRS